MLKSGHTFHLIYQKSPKTNNPPTKNPALRVAAVMKSEAVSCIQASFAVYAYITELGVFITLVADDAPPLSPSDISSPCCWSLVTKILIKLIFAQEKSVYIYFFISNVLTCTG